MGQIVNFKPRRGSPFWRKLFGRSIPKTVRVVAPPSIVADDESLRQRVHRLCTPFNQKKCDVYRGTVQSYTNAQLRTLIANAGDDDVQRRPYFYMALFDEANNRRIELL